MYIQMRYKGRTQFSSASFTCICAYLLYEERGEPGIETTSSTALLIITLNLSLMCIYVQVCNGDEYVRVARADFGKIASRVNSYKSSAGLRDSSTNADTCNVGSESDWKASDSAEDNQGDRKRETTLQDTPTSSESIPLPRLLRSSLFDVDSIPFVRLGNGLSPSDDGGVIINHTGVMMRIQGVPEGILERETEYYCCVACGKVFWEGKHFAQVIHQFQHVLEFSSRLLPEH